MLNVIDVENELCIEAEFMNVSRIEQIDKDVTYALQKARRKVEGKVIGFGYIKRKD